jgi:hypothetical protein
MLPGTNVKEDVQKMRSEREIREQIISQLMNIYISTPDLEGQTESQPLFEDPDAPEWTAAEFEVAYTEVMAMFMYYAREVEDQGGPSFLEHLERQARLNSDDDQSPGAS